MKKRWLFLIVSVFLILVLAGCTQSNGNVSPPEQDQSAPEVEQEAAADQDDDMADEQEEGDTDHDDSDMVEEEEAEADSEEVAAPEIDAAALYAGNCAGCHGPDRAGGGAPALLPSRLTKDATVYVNTITNGSGPMPAFGGKFSAEEIDALVAFILSEPQ